MIWRREESVAVAQWVVNTKPTASKSLQIQALKDDVMKAPGNSHPSPSIHLPIEGRGKMLVATFCVLAVIMLFKRLAFIVYEASGL
jgi:hypothetical protein